MYTKKFTLSRQKFVCPICKTTKRSDKLSEHITNLCHFNDAEEAYPPWSSAFKHLSKEAKFHTQYCYDRKISKKMSQKWKNEIPSKSTEEFDCSYFKKWKKNPEEKEETVIQGDSLPCK